MAAQHARPTFLTNCINVALFARVRQRRSPAELPLRQETDAHLEQIAAFVAQWADGVVANLTAEAYAPVRARMDAPRAALDAELAAWRARRALDAPDFYDAFVATSSAVFKLCCQVHDLGAQLYYQAVQTDLAQLTPMLAWHEPAPDADPKATAEAITKAYRHMTATIAKMVEGMLLMALQPTTDAAYQDEVKALAEAFEIENELMADIINNMNDFVQRDLKLFDESLVDLSRHLGDVRMFAADLDKSLQEHIEEVAKHDSFKDYEQVVLDAENYFATCKETMLDELAQVDVHSTLAALQAARRADGEPSPALLDVAKGTDDLERGLAKTQFAIALDENLPDMIDVVQNLQPVLSRLPQKLAATATESMAKLNKSIDQTRTMMRDQDAAVLKALELLDVAKDQPEDKQWEAVQASLEYPNLFIDLMNAISFEQNDVLFNNDATLMFRDQLQELTDEVNVAHKAMHLDNSGAPLSVILTLTNTLSKLAEPLKTYQNFFEANAAVEVAVLEDIKNKSPAFVRATSAALIDATNQVVSDGLVDGRDRMLLNACRRLSAIVDVSRQMCTVAEYVAEAPRREETLPSLGYLSQSDVLDTVRVLYAMPDVPADEAPEKPQERMYRVGRGIVKRQVVRIEDGELIQRSISKLRTVGKLGENIFTEMEKKHKQELMKQAAQGGKAGLKAQEQLRKMGITKPITTQSAAKAGKAKVIKLNKAYDDASLEAFKTALEGSIYHETGKILTEIDPASQQTIVRAGTVNQLINYLTLPDAVEKSPAFQSVFLLTMQTFIDPAVFLRKLIDRYNVPACPPGADPRAYDLAFRYPVQLRVYDVLKLWLSHRGFQDLATTQDVLPIFNQFVDEYIEQQSKTIANNLRRCYQLCAQNERYAENARWSQLDKPIYKELKVAGAPLFQEIVQMFDVRKVAQQLTLVDATVFRAITLAELKDQRWLRPESAVKAPHLVEMITQTNRLATFVVRAILAEANVRGRRRVLSKMLALGAELLRLRNFHSLFAVVAGLQSLAIRRLTFTIQELPGKLQKTLASLTELASPANDFAVYRDRLAQCEVPAIPFMGTLLLDISTVESSHWATVNLKLSAGQVDWPSREELAKRALASLVSFQRECHYKYEMDPLLCTSILNIIDEYQTSPPGLFKLSMTAEPPNSYPPEKTGFSGLKSVFALLGAMW